jgi:polygalacturonase
MLFLAAAACDLETQIAETADQTTGYLGSWAQVPVILARVNEPVFAATEVKVTDFGAVADGQTDARQAIQDAIIHVSSMGGGTVKIPAGDYYSDGPIDLHSNVNLHFSEDSHLKFSDKPASYPAVLTLYEGTWVYNYSPMIYAYQKKNIALTGKGTIDGGGSGAWVEWWKKTTEFDGEEVQVNRVPRRWNNASVPLSKRNLVEQYPEGLRPGLIQVIDGQNILVKDVKLIDSPFWTLHFYGSRNITVRGVRFETFNPNNDGIDVESSEDVLIRDVVFNNGDDNIAIKSGRDLEGRTIGKTSKNIVIQNVEFNAYTGLAIGSEIAAGARNVFLEDSHANSKLKRGIYVKSNLDRGGETQHLRVRNVNFKDTTQQMIALSTDYGDARYNHSPSFHDFRLEDIVAEGPSSIGLDIKGTAEVDVNNIVFDRVNLGRTKRSHRIKFADEDTIWFRDVTVDDAPFPLFASDNLPPDVYAGEDLDVDLKSVSTVLLSGVAQDADSDPLTYRWRQVAGPVNGVTFADSSSARTELTISEKGQYQVRLHVSDGKTTGYHTLFINAH